MPFPTGPELASYLQQDLDLSTATLVLAQAQAEFEAAADTKFTSTAATETFEGWGSLVIALSHKPVIAITEIRIDGTILPTTEYTRVSQNLYRRSGWGRDWIPPRLVEVDYTHGFTAVPDDVKGAVLEMAAQAYGNPDGVTQFQIDDYSERRERGHSGLGLTLNAAIVAHRYRFAGFA